MLYMVLLIWLPRIEVVICCLIDAILLQSPFGMTAEYAHPAETLGRLSLFPPLSTHDLAKTY